MTEFYDMTVFPARARRPKDKALVENAVKLMYRSVYTDIEGYAALPSGANARGFSNKQIQSLFSIGGH